MIGESMAFRYVLPMRQRQQIRAALGVKWFGTDTYSLKYGFEDVAVTNGAAAAFPHADVAVTNLALAGTVSAKSLAVKNVDLLGDATVAAPLTVEAGGSIVLHGDGTDGFAEVSVDSLSIARGGSIVVPDVLDGRLCGRSYRVFSTANISGTGMGWSGKSADGSLRAQLESRADGLYLKFVSGGVRIIFR